MNFLQSAPAYISNFLSFSLLKLCAWSYFLLIQEGEMLTSFFWSNKKTSSAWQSTLVRCLFFSTFWHGTVYLLLSRRILLGKKIVREQKLFPLFLFLFLGHIDLFQRILRDAVYYSSCTARHLNTYRIRKGLQASPCKWMINRISL